MHLARMFLLGSMMFYDSMPLCHPEEASWALWQRKHFGGVLKGIDQPWGFRDSSAATDSPMVQLMKYFLEPPATEEVKLYVPDILTSEGGEKKYLHVYTLLPFWMVNT